MFTLFFFSIIILLISSMMMILNLFMSKKMILNREKCSPFECGFDPMTNSRIPFSLHFFLITIIFLIFDVEIVLLMPLIIILNFSNLFSWMLTSLFFIIILLIGLFHEWNQGMLNWST